MRGESLLSILNNYSVVQVEWEECLESRLQPEIRARIIGVKTQMQKFDYVFGVVLGERIPKHTDNLSKTLQHKHLSAAEGQAAAELTVKTLKTIRTEESFDLFWEFVPLTASKHDVEDPMLPRCRKVPQRFEL